MSLRERVLSCPDDVDAHLVYGDALVDRGDPRGDLVALHARMREDPSLAPHAEALIAANAPTWLGALRHEDMVSFTWSLGFVRGVRFEPHPDELDGPIDWDGLIRELLSLPDIDFVRELVFEGLPLGPRWGLVVRALVRHGVPRVLRSLAFGHGACDISSTAIGDVSPLYPQLERLEELRVELGNIRFGEVRLPSLRALTVVTTLNAENARALAGAAWPALESLSVCLGAPQQGCDVALADLEPVLRGDLPRLRSLGVRSCSFADELAGELRRAKVLPQLEEIDLSLGTLANDGARALLDPAFGHLRRLIVGDHFLDEDTASSLEGAFGERLVLGRALGEEPYVQLVGSPWGRATWGDDD